MLNKFFIYSLFIFIIMGAGCKKEYSDLRESFNQVIKVGDVFVSSIDSADSSKKIIDAIELYKKEMNAATPKFRTVMKKYKDINLRNPKTIPPAIEDVYKQYQETQDRLGNSINTIMTKFSSDKSVKESLKSMFPRKGGKMKSHKPVNEDDKD